MWLWPRGANSHFTASNKLMSPSRYGMRTDSTHTHWSPRNEFLAKATALYR